MNFPIWVLRYIEHELITDYQKAISPVVEEYYLFGEVELRYQMTRIILDLLHKNNIELEYDGEIGWTVTKHNNHSLMIMMKYSR